MLASYASTVSYVANNMYEVVLVTCTVCRTSSLFHLFYHLQRYTLLFVEPGHSWHPSQTIINSSSLNFTQTEHIYTM